MENLTLIIPAKNEKESLPIFLQELDIFYCKKIIVIASNDKETLAAIKSFKNLKIVIQKNDGYGNALIEGIQNVDTEYCCIINADGSMNPKYLDAKLDLCKKYDFIFSSRYQGKGGSDDDDIITLIGNKIFSLIGRLFFSLNITDILYTYVMAKTSSIKNLRLRNYDFRICVELPIKAKRKNYKIKSIESYERPRIAGSKKVSPFKDGFLIFLELIKLYFIK